MRIAIVDTLYPEVIRNLGCDMNSSYERELRRKLDYSFGTADFYSRNLKPLGWETLDIIANHKDLQGMWGKENNVTGGFIFAQIQKFNPDVVFLQDLSFLGSGLMEELRDKYTVAGQCSCPFPPVQNLRCCDVIFSSIPSHVEHFKSLGIHSIYNPLAFEASLAELFVGEKKRPLDCVFVGGVGTPSHWKYGMEVLNHVAERIPTFMWWGYGADLLPEGILKRRYAGQAFGRDMYRIMANSKIVLNRHGEISGPYANNMRLFESTGVGAMLLTDWKENIGSFFSPSEVVCYTNPAQAVDAIKYFLSHEDERAEIAKAGQLRTLRDHTYSKRMQLVSNTLKDMLVAA